MGSLRSGCVVIGAEPFKGGVMCQPRTEEFGQHFVISCS